MNQRPLSRVDQQPANDRDGRKAEDLFLQAVQATVRRKLVVAGIATEICLAYPVVSALDDGYEVSFIADAVGGVTKYAHDIAVTRMIQAGAVPNTAMAIISEWFRDWDSPRGSIARDIIKDFIADLAKLGPAAV